MSEDEDGADDEAADDEAAADTGIAGFGDAVDGVHDVADQLRQSLLARATAELEDDRDAKATLDSRTAFERRRDRVRARFRDAIGGLPDRPNDPTVASRDEIERRGYTVERLVLEVLPEFHVTANCYVPAEPGPHPAVLLAGGHHPFPKADPANQRLCIALARHGIVVLCPDVVGTGERDQYPDADETHGTHPVFHGSGVYAHSLAGQQAHYAGGNVARYFVHEARTALDYLESRHDVDPDRLAVTGTSGGGMLTVYLALVDDRPAAIAPCCWVCDRDASMRAGFPIDHEQVVHAAIPEPAAPDAADRPDAVDRPDAADRPDAPDAPDESAAPDVGFDVDDAGIGVDDLATGLAPTPICVGAARSDFFPIEGVRSAYDRIERAYTLLDAGDDCQLAVADTQHAPVGDIPGVVDFLCAELTDDPFHPDGDAPAGAEGDLGVAEAALLDRETLQCTPEGSVLESYPDERTLTALVADHADATARTADGTPRAADADPADVDVDALAERVRDRLRFDRLPTSDRDPRVVATDAHDDLAVERVFWKTGCDRDVVVTGVIVSTPDEHTDESDASSDDDGTGEGEDPPAIVRFEHGTRELPERTDEVAALARRHGTVLVFDPRGVGATRQRPTPAPWGEPAYDGVYGTTHALSANASLLGDSLFGMRVRDLVDASEYLRDRTHADRVTLLGDGIARYDALYAVAATARKSEAAPELSTPVAAVEGLDDDPLASFRARTMTTRYGFDPRLDAFDVLDCDLPDVAAALQALGVDVAVELAVGDRLD